jgi:hypothetical protein
VAIANPARKMRSKNIVDDSIVRKIEEAVIDRR